MTLQKKTICENCNEEYSHSAFTNMNVKPLKDDQSLEAEYESDN